MKDMMELSIARIQNSQQINLYNKTGDNKCMKKFILTIILAMTLVSCELLDSNSWDRAHRKAAERGRKCYETSSGYYYCENTKQEKIYI